MMEILILIAFGTLTNVGLNIATLIVTIKKGK